MMPRVALLGAIFYQLGVAQASHGPSTMPL